MQEIQPFQRLLSRCRSWLMKTGNRPIRPLDNPGHVHASTLKQVASTFVDGFSIAIETDTRNLEREIGVMKATDRGVGYEGASAAKAVLDLTSQVKFGLSRQTESHLGDSEPALKSVIQAQLSQSTALLTEADRYTFLLFLGIGEAMAQLKLPPVLCNEIANELWCGQILEGYGFFDGYFNWFDSLVNQRYPAALKPELRSFYDQGLGRAIYFVTNSSPTLIRDYINNFPLERRSELWSGVGIPTAYVGGLSEKELRKLIDYSGTYRAEIMQGVLLGASARAKQELVPDHTELACNIVCGMHLIEGLSVTSELEQMLQLRESYNMADWQAVVRKLLRKEAC